MARSDSQALERSAAQPFARRQNIRRNFVTIRRPGATKLVLFMLCVMYFITYIDRVNIGTAASAIKDEFHLSNVQLGLVFSAFAYPYALLQIFGGWLGDRFGSRKMLFASGLLWGSATILTGFAGGLASLIFFRLLLGVGEGATFPCATRSMQSWVPVEKRGFAQGVTHSAARLGNAITPPLIAFLMIAVSWRGSFVILGIVSLLWVVVWYWYYRDNPADHRGVSKSELEALPIQDAKRISAPVPWKKLALRMLPVTVVYFCYGWTLWLYLNWLPSYFMHAHKLNLQTSALFASGVFFAGVVGDTLGGVVSDKILRSTGRVRLARISVVVVGFVGSLCSLVPVLFFARTGSHRDLSQRRVLLRRTRHRPHVVNTDGHCAQVFRYRGRTDEYRIRGGSDSFAPGIRLHHRQDGQLGIALHRLHRASGRGRVARFHHATGQALCGGKVADGVPGQRQSRHANQRLNSLTPGQRAGRWQSADPKSWRYSADGRARFATRD
jgi:sugar phosphate permease